MSRKSDLLVEQEALLKGIKSERDHLLRLANSRPARRRAVQNAVKRIRTLRVALAEEFVALSRARGVSGGESTILAEIDKWNKRIGELTKTIATTRAQQRVERLMKLAAEINAMEDEFPAIAAMVHDEPTEDEIIS